jgi:hypothetical protein
MSVSVDIWSLSEIRPIDPVWFHTKTDRTFGNNQTTNRNSPPEVQNWSPLTLGASKKCVPTRKNVSLPGEQTQ